MSHVIRILGNSLNMTGKIVMLIILLIILLIVILDTKNIQRKRRKLIAFNTKVREALLKINFIERYEELSNLYSDKRIPKDGRLVYVDREEVIETIHDLGYSAKFRAKEKFYQIQEEKKGGFIFGFHIILYDGTVDLVWVVKKDYEVLLEAPWGIYPKRLTGSNYIIEKPVIGDYGDLEYVLREAFIMFEDFKNAFLTQ